MIDKDHKLPITKQCKLLELSRSSVYYEPAPVSDKDRELIRLIDEIHLECPYFGSRGIKSILKRKGSRQDSCPYPYAEDGHRGNI